MGPYEKKNLVPIISWSWPFLVGGGLVDGRDSHYFFGNRYQIHIMTIFLVTWIKNISCHINLII